MKKHVLLGLVAAAAVAVSAAPAGAHVETKLCGPPTSPHPCVCVYEGPVSKCTP
jgi:hypothetical protein